MSNKRYPTAFVSFLIIICLLFISVFNRAYAQMVMIFIGIYWTYRNLAFVVFTFLSLKEKLGVFDLRQHPTQIFCIPTYKESIETISKTLDSIYSQEYPLGKIYTVISFEARSENDYQQYLTLKSAMVNKLGKDFDDNIIVTKHPENIIGEAPGAASNKTWASKTIIQHLVDKNKLDDNTLITIPDADTTFSKTYAKELAFKSCKIKTNNVFFQTRNYFVANNYNEMSYVSKLLSLFLTQSIMASSSLFGSSRYTFSCFSLRVSTLLDVDYWDNSNPIDDTPFYWRLFDKYKARPRCVLLVSEVYVDGIDGGIKRSLVKQYQQLYRWGWGAFTMSNGFRSIILNEKFPFNLLSSFRLIDRFIIVKFLPVFIFTGFLIYQSNPTEYWEAIIHINLILLGFEVLTMIRIINRFKLISPISITLSIFKIPVSILLLTFYGFIPYFHSAFDMIKGKGQQASITWSNNK